MNFEKIFEKKLLKGMWIQLELCLKNLEFADLLIDFLKTLMRRLALIK